LLLEGLHRLALVYELTQTFCPNLILYYSIANLLVFTLSQVEAQSRYGLSHSLYVKHDVYRFLVVGILFFAITAATQLSTYGPKMLIAFILCFPTHIFALNNYTENKFSRCCLQLLGVGVTFSAIEILFARYLWYFITFISIKSYFYFHQYLLTICVHIFYMYFMYM
jgi:hypothetical protein